MARLGQTYGPEYWDQLVQMGQPFGDDHLKSLGSGLSSAMMIIRIEKKQNPLIAGFARYHRRFVAA